MSCLEHKLSWTISQVSGLTFQFSSIEIAETIGSRISPVSKMVASAIASKFPSRVTRVPYIIEFCCFDLHRKDPCQALSGIAPLADVAPINSEICSQDPARLGVSTSRFLWRIQLGKVLPEGPKPCCFTKCSMLRSAMVEILRFGDPSRMLLGYSHSLLAIGTHNYIPINRLVTSLLVRLSQWICVGSCLEGPHVILLSCFELTIKTTKTTNLNCDEQGTPKLQPQCTYKTYL